MTDALVQALTGQRSLASSRLVLIGDRTGSKELYFCDADGANLTQWTQDRSIGLGPSWNPRGGQVVYTSFLQGFADLYLITLATGKRVCISHYPGINTGGDLSPDGQETALILSKDGYTDLYIKDVTGDRLIRLTRTRFSEASPSWSPDGQRLVYVADPAGAPQLFIIGRSGGVARLITTRGSENVAPDWGANGLIAYASRRNGRYAVAVYDPKAQSHRVISPADADYEDPSWAPDGRHIFCSRTAGNKADIYRLDSSGDPPLRLTTENGNWRSPACSP